MRDFRQVNQLLTGKARIIASIPSAISITKQDVDIRHLALSVTKDQILTMTQRKNNSVKSLDIQLTSHEASRYLKLAKETEFPSLQSCLCFTEGGFADAHILPPRAVYLILHPGLPKPQPPSLRNQNHGDNSAGQSWVGGAGGGRGQVSKKLHHPDKSLKPPSFHVLFCEMPIMTSAQGYCKRQIG